MTIFCLSHVFHTLGKLSFKGRWVVASWNWFREAVSIPSLTAGWTWIAWLCADTNPHNFAPFKYLLSPCLALLLQPSHVVFAWQEWQGNSLSGCWGSFWGADGTCECWEISLWCVFWLLAHKLRGRETMTDEKWDVCRALCSVKYGIRPWKWIYPLHTLEVWRSLCT